MGPDARCPLPRADLSDAPRRPARLLEVTRLRRRGAGLMAAPRSALSAALASYGRPRPPRRGGYQGRAPQPRSRLSGVKASSDYLPGWPAAARVEGASATGRV